MDFTNLDCPGCKQPLAYAKDAAGVTVWCPWGSCGSLGNAPNEGGHGRSIKLAHAALMMKLGRSAPAEPTNKVDLDMFKDLLTYEDLNEACAELFGFGQVTFLRDFGPFKQGEKVPNVWFNLEEGEVTAYAEDGQTQTHSFKFKVQA